MESYDSPTCTVQCGKTTALEAVRETRTTGNRGADVRLGRWCRISTSMVRGGQSDPRPSGSGRLPLAPEERALFAVAGRIGCVTGRVTAAPRDDCAAHKGQHYKRVATGVYRRRRLRLSFFDRTRLVAVVPALNLGITPPAIILENCVPIFSRCMKDWPDIIFIMLRIGSNCLTS